MDEMFRYPVRHMIGQLHPNTPVGNFLNHTAKNPEYKTFVEGLAKKNIDFTLTDDKLIKLFINRGLNNQFY